MDVLILIGAFLVILFGAELFTNGIEWFGRKLELAEGAVGSVLAAVGTALPETMIPIIAILSGGGSAASHGIGVGAILGAPFMLSTLAMFVTGIAVLYVGRMRTKRDDMPVDTGVLAHDMRYFGIAYAIAIGAAFLPIEPAWPFLVVAGRVDTASRPPRQAKGAGNPGRRSHGEDAGPTWRGLLRPCS